MHASDWNTDLWMLQVLSWGWNDRATLGHSHRYSCLRFAILAECCSLLMIHSMYRQTLPKGTCVMRCRANNCLIDREHERKPRRVAALRGMEITQVSTGGWHCLALDAAGLVYAWGGNEYGQCNVEWNVRSVVQQDALHSLLVHYS
jgi:alpha-tubulin suppressor-like RCC1 family protein